jgi:GT2 family glycosyltransferase
MPPELAIVIPTWNRRDLVCACLDTLRAQTWRAFEVIVVDDGSEDDTAEVLARDYPEARVIRLARNGGFVAAANAGLQQATAPWILLLNNDMTLAPDCLEHLMAAAQAGTADLLAPLVCWQDEPEVIYSAGDRLCRNGRPEAIGFRQPRAAFEPPRQVFGVSGGAGLIRRTVLERIGYLEPAFTAYFEDADFSCRARLAGFTAACVPEARAWHIGSASIAGKTWWRSAQCCRNHALLIIRTFPCTVIVRHAPAILAERVHQYGMVFSAARAAFGARRAVGIVLHTATSTWAALPGALAARWRIQRMRRITPAAFGALLSEDTP